MHTRTFSEGEDRYKTFVHLAPDIVYTLAKDGTIKSLSSSFEKITGWRVNDWLGKNFVPLVHPEDVNKAIKIFKQTIIHGKVSANYELRIVKKDGSYLIAEFSSAPDVANGKIVGKIGIARDVTEQRREEQTYLHYTNLIRSADAAIISRDVNGKILTWNHAAEEFFGYKMEEVIGCDFTIIVPRDKLKEFRRNDKKVRSGKLIEDYETVRLTKSGKRIDILAKNSPIRDNNGNIIGVSVFDRENTETIRARKQEEFLTKASKTLSSSLNYKATLKKVANIMVPEFADWSSVHIIEDGKLEQLTVAHKDRDMVEKVLDFQKKMAREVNKKSSHERLKKLLTGKTQFYPHITSEMIYLLVKREDDRKLLKEIGGVVSAIVVPIVSGKKDQ